MLWLRQYQPLHYEPRCRRPDHNAVRGTGDCSVYAQSRLVARTDTLQVTAIYSRLFSVRFHLDADGRLHWEVRALMMMMIIIIIIIMNIFIRQTRQRDKQIMIHDAQNTCIDN